MAHSNIAAVNEPPIRNSSPCSSYFRWMPTGAHGLAEMLKAIHDASHNVRLEMYIFQNSGVGEVFRDALIAAARRGATVYVLTDYFGSFLVPEDFWSSLTTAGGQVRRFNLPGWSRFGLRDHRKLLICDERFGFVTSHNIGPEYAGDGVFSGWRDLGLQFEGDLARELAGAFDEMFSISKFRDTHFIWRRHAVRQRRVEAKRAIALLSAPGWKRNHLLHALITDFQSAHSIRILCAYFLPTHRLLRALIRAARRGANVQLVLSAQCDVPLLQNATHCYYRRLLKSGVEIYEYKPQNFHAKMIIVDEDVVYAGSANLDVRSLHLNYELLIRVHSRQVAEEAAEIFCGDLKHCRKIHLKEWTTGRHWWNRAIGRLACFFFTRIDPYLASWSWRR